MPRPPEFGRVDASRVDKPWGYELRWATTDRYLGKVLHITRGEALSLQYHERKDEYLYVASGSVEIELAAEGDSELGKHRMEVGDTLHIAPGTRHRLTALEDTDIFEVSTPEVEDVVRLEDRYGRAKTDA
ncbi:MAG TPA: cupin domain-containing protein [Candidatus Dormibacteraeota bacterium]|jgi:mannose-6-phosphate isomerase-like protein (cupin superfamily)